MKNKSEKLARNAIRARKAKNKRANEQDKSKKGKRWLIRLGTLMGSLLLVSALVVPCFAVDFEVPEPPIGEAPIDPPAIDDNTALSIKQEMFISSLAPTFSDNDCAYFLSDFYWRESATLGGVGLFNFNSFISGTMKNLGNYSSTFNETYLYEFTTLGRDYSFEEKIYLDSFSIQFSEELYDSTYMVVGSRDDDLQGTVYLPYVGFHFYYTHATDTVKVKIDFVDSVQNTVGAFDRVDIWFTGYFDRELASNRLTLNFDYIQYTLADEIDTFYSNDVNYISYAFVPRVTNYPTFYFGAMTSLLSANSPYGYNYCVYNPANFYYGYENGFDVGVDVAYGRGWNTGFDVGYTDGYTDGYNTGYGRAYSEISSGDFGRNLIGNSLSAPIEGLKQFELISWETAGGRTISINIITVLSAVLGVTLVIWFLKLFAGG